MKNCRNIITVITIIGCSIIYSSATAQNLYVKEQNGTQNSYTLSNIEKITFTNSEMQIEKNGNNADNYVLSDLRYISFEDLHTEINNTNNTTALSVFPNPANKQLTLVLPPNVKLQGTIEIYTLQGKKVYTEKISQNSNKYVLDISFLTKGFYLIKIQNNNSVNTIKFIKN